MKKLLYTILSVSFLCLAACDLSGECEGTASAVFTINSDVTTDFSEDNAAFTAEVLTSTCSNLGEGESADDTVDNISRASDTLTFTFSDESIDAAVNGGNIEEFSYSISIAGCDLNLVLNGTVESSDNTLVTSGEFTASGLSCDTSL